MQTHDTVPGPDPSKHFPDPPVRRWAHPFVRFFQIEAASGFILLICTIVALAIANSPWAEDFNHFWHTHIRISAGPYELDYSLLHWVNDALMAIFFFVVGLEIKREIVAGELRDPRKAALPIMAALGGMVAPAAIYWSLMAGKPGESGWGIPMATDIAFVVGFLALLGPRVPFGLKIMLLSLAIADDIGAVLVIAVFYSTSISFVMLGLAALGFAFTYFLNRIGVRKVGIYVVVGAFIWLAFLKSGVHPTVAGVMLGLLTPASAWIGNRALIDVVDDVLACLRSDADDRPEYHQRPLLNHLEFAARESASPLERLEKGLHPWVAFIIMPIFALGNAGVTVELGAITHPVALAVAAGLCVGKPLGIFLFSWLAVQLGIARLPSGVNWKVMIGAGCLGGIGFTMSLFVAGLAFPGHLPEAGTLLDAGKIGTLTGSTVSAILGCILLLMFLPKPGSHAKSESAQASDVAIPTH
jgi:NhaA family Na+:H+ antiporter